MPGTIALRKTAMYLFSEYFQSTYYVQKSFTTVNKLDNKVPLIKELSFQKGERK